MRRSTLLLLVAGILGVLVFVATRTIGFPERTSALEPGATPVDTHGGPNLVGASAPTNDRTVVAPETGGGVSALDEDSGWSVCVVDGRTKAPVAGATVSVIDVEAIGQELYIRGIGFDTIEGLRTRRERAVEALTGADGSARIASPPEHALVEARSGGAWAFTVVNEVPDDRRVTLELAPDRELPVRVVDTAGNPVGGVPVALRRKDPARPSFTCKWTDTRPGTGIATFLHFQRRLAQGAGWHATFAFPLADEPVIPVDADTQIEPPIKLVLPDTGRVRVRVRAADGGAPDLEGIDLRLDAYDRGSRVWPDGPWARPNVAATGDALAPWIGLGLELEAVLERDGEEVATSPFAGPARPGEEVVCDLVWSPRIVTGRLVFRDGRAWPRTTVQARATIFPPPSTWPRTRAIEVQDDGRFRMQVCDARPTGGTRAYRFSARRPDGGGEVIASVPLDLDVPPGGLDLGDVVLDLGDLLVAGRVVDEARRPIAGARLWVHERTPASGEEFWPQIPSAGTRRSAVDVAFSLHLVPGEPQPGEELRLETRAEGFVAEPGRDVLRGDRTLEVVLARAGALAGSLVLDHGLARDDVTLTLGGETRRYASLRPDGTFEVLELPPGAYSLEVRCRGENGRFDREPAALVDDLLVREGETCRDPRIQALRIECELATLRIRVVDRASTPLKGVAVSIGGLADGQPFMSDEDGVCLVHCAALPVDLDVSAFGYQRRWLANVSGDQDVVLDAGFPIRLHTSARTSGNDPQYVLGAFLYSVDAGGVTRGAVWGPEYAAGYSADRAFFDEHGELALRMPAAGVYECEVHVTVLAGNVGRGGAVTLSPRHHITVLESSAEQRFELTIPEEAIQEAVQRALH